MKKFVGIIFVLFLISNVFAICENGQIDVNSAGASELDKLAGIGPVKSEAIINARPFGSLDDLINVYGIGEITLENIKAQRLACVENEKEEEKEKEILNKTIVEKNESEENKKIEVVSTKAISLNSKDIKSSDGEKSSSTKYVLYSFVLFCVLLGVLYILKIRKRKDGLE